MKKFRNAIFGVTLLLGMIGCGVETTQSSPQTIAVETTPVKQTAPVKEIEIEIPTTTSEQIAVTTTTHKPHVTTTTKKPVPKVPQTVAPKVETPTQTTVPQTVPPTTKPPVSTNINSFLACVKQHESRGNYSAVNPSSGAGGAYQFLQSTWNNVAKHIGRNDLVGIHPSKASPGTQDMMAVALYNWYGKSPWAGSGC